MKRIVIELIPHKAQRYETIGDWMERDDGDEWRIFVSSFDDWRYTVLIAIHELVEMAWCFLHGVSEESVSAFDIDYEKKRKKGDTSEPGDDPRAPYHTGHRLATRVERMAAIALGVRWIKYNEIVSSI